MIMGTAGSQLDSLDHRRKVGALSYFYKLQCRSGPTRLLSMIPPPLARPAVGRTRASLTASDAWHPRMFALPSPNSNDQLKRAFPYGIVPLWNSLPHEILDEEPSLSRLNHFKSSVNLHLRSHVRNGPSLQ